MVLLIVLIISLFFFYYWRSTANANNVLISDLLLLKNEIASARKIGAEEESSAQEIIDRVAGQGKIAGDLKTELLRVRQRIFQLNTDLGPQSLALDDIRGAFRGKEVIDSRLRLRIVESLPSLFTGFGLLFTFVFLAMALYGLDIKGTQGLETVSGVLAAASAKFLTSIAGLLCAMLTSVYLNNYLASCARALIELEDELYLLVSDRGAEESVEFQLQLLTELLSESREQVGQLKRFETDFAVSIAGAIEKAMSNKFEAHSSSSNAHNERLILALAGIKTATEKTGSDMVEKIGGINEQALQKMVGDLQSLVRDTMSAEMEQMKEGLASLANDLRSSGETVKQAIVEAGGSFAETIKEKTVPVLEDISRELSTTASNIAREVTRAADQINASGENLSKSMIDSGLVMRAEVETATKSTASFFESANESIRVTLHQFKEFFDSSVKQTLDQLNAAGIASQDTLRSITEGMQSATTQLSDLIQKSAMENVRVTQNLQDAAVNVEKVFADISDHFTSTGKVITDVVAGFEGTGKNLGNTATILSANTEKFTDAATSLDTVSKQMHDAAREVSAGSKQVVDATTMAMSKFQEMSKMLERVNSDLGVTLDSMNNGLSTYASKLRDLHQSMDQELAKAISQLEFTVSDMTESLDDIVIKLDKAKVGV